MNSSARSGSSLISLRTRGFRRPATARANITMNPRCSSLSDGSAKSLNLNIGCGGQLRGTVDHQFTRSAAIEAITRTQRKAGRDALLQAREGSPEQALSSQSPIFLGLPSGVDEKVRRGRQRRRSVLRSWLISGTTSPGRLGWTADGPPLGKNWCRRTELNCGPTDYELLFRSIPA
jgi:hypothetical protein